MSTLEDPSAASFEITRIVLILIFTYCLTKLQLNLSNAMGSALVFPFLRLVLIISFIFAMHVMSCSLFTLHQFYITLLLLSWKFTKHNLHIFIFPVTLFLNLPFLSLFSEFSLAALLVWPFDLPSMICWWDSIPFLTSLMHEMDISMDNAVSSCYCMGKKKPCDIGCWVWSG